MPRRRLDAELVRRGLATTREEAVAAVEAGRVTVSGMPAAKPNTLVDAGEPVHVARAVSQRFVSRGGEKLTAGLDRFGIDPAGRDCLDVGASTGGFTDCLLQRGAARVAAVDVGYGRLAWSLRSDARVVVLERRNVRQLASGALPFAPSLVVADLSFISLRLALPALVGVARSHSDFVLLVKPQFEAPSARVEPGGVVSDPDVWRSALVGVGEACRAEGLTAQAAMASPLTGPAGNVEFFLHAVLDRRSALFNAAALEAAIAEGLGLKERG